MKVGERDRLHHGIDFTKILGDFFQGRSPLSLYHERPTTTPTFRRHTWGRYVVRIRSPLFLYVEGRCVWRDPEITEVRNIEDDRCALLIEVEVHTLQATLLQSCGYAVLRG